MTLLVAALLSIYLLGNGRVPLFDRDEPRYAVTSRAMLESGDWVVPRFLGEVRTAKPPAIYWLQAAAMKALGTSEFAVRLPGALACAATIGFLAITLPPLVGRRRAKWACFMLGTSVLVLGVAKVGVIDGVLLLCVATMQVALLRIVLSRGVTTWNAVLLWTAVGAGGMLKGPVILGVLGMTLLAWWASRWIVSPSTTNTPGPWSRQGRGLFVRLRPLVGLLIIALLCGPWLMMISIRAPDFLATAIGHDVATRSVSGLEGHGQPPGFHLLALFGTWFPWSVLLPATFLHAWRRRGHDTIRFALAACVGPWIMFELVVTKLPHYLLVIFPMLALLTADWLVITLNRIGRHGAFPPGMRTAGVIYAMVALAFAAAPPLLGVFSWPATLICVAWAFAMPVCWWRGRIAYAVIAAGAGLAVFVATAYVGWLGQSPMLNVSRRTADALHEAGAASAVMVHYKEPSLAWYAAERGIAVHEADEGVMKTAAGFAISTRRRLSSMPEEVRRRWEVREAINARLYNNELQAADVLILRSREPPTTTD